jgi:PAS domain S-box-containing protein
VEPTVDQPPPNPEPFSRAAPALACLLDAATDYYFLLDAHWRFVYLNRHALRELGTGPEALLGRTLWEAYPALLGTEVEAHYRRAVAEQTPACFETRGVLSGRWYEVHAYPCPAGLAVHGRDITDRKQAEEELRASEQRHRLISELTSDYAYVCRVDPDGVIRLESVTEGFTRVTGFTLAECEARGGWASLLHPDDLGPSRAHVEQMMAQQRGVVLEVRLLTKDGQTRWVRFSAQPVLDPAQGRVVRLVGAVQDVTERRQAEAAVRASEERFRRFMDNGPVVAWIKDDQGRFAYVNRPWRDLYAPGPDDPVGLSHFDLWPADVAERFQAGDREVLAADGPREFTEPVPAADGVVRDWHVYKFPFRDAAGRRYVGGMAVNVTERLHAEQKLQEYARQLQALSRRLLEVQEQERRALARELHDEVGQALTGLKLTLEAAHHDPGGAGERLGEALALVQDLAGRARDLSLRLRPTMLDDLGLLPALLWYQERYTARTGVHVRLGHCGLGRRFAPAVETAAYRIAQEALTNVARHARVGEAVVWAEVEGGWLRLAVEDWGVGFDPAARTNGESGGVSGMRERAALLGGRLVVEAVPGAGTRVVAELPVGGADGGATNGTDRDARG